MNDNDKKILSLKNSKEMIEFKNYYRRDSIVEQIGFLNEDTHTNYLKSVLDDHNTNMYSFKDDSFKLFLEFLKSHSNTEILKFINPFQSYDITDLKIDLRDARFFKKVYPDMIITFKHDKKPYIIVLEAKTMSDEHDMQCKKYYEDLQKYDESQKEKWEEKIFVYLTLDGRECSMKDKYINISYQQLIENLYTPLLYSESNNTSLNLEDYIKSFNQFYFEKVDSVITPTGSQLTCNLWKEHSHEFIEIFENEDLLSSFREYMANNKELKIILYNNIRIKADELIKIDPNSATTVNNISNYSKKLVTGYEIVVDNISKNIYRDKLVYKVLDVLYNNFSQGKLSLNDFKKAIEDINVGVKYKYIYTEQLYNELNNYRSCYSKDYYNDKIITIKNERGEKEPLWYMSKLNQEDAEILKQNIDNSSIIKDLVKINLTDEIKTNERKFKMLKNNYNSEIITISTKLDDSKLDYLEKIVKDAVNVNKKVLYIALDNSDEKMSKRLSSSNVVYSHNPIKDINELNNLVNENKAEVLVIDYYDLLPNDDNNLHNVLRNIADTNNIPIIVTRYLNRNLRDLDINEIDINDIIAHNKGLFEISNQFIIVDGKNNRVVK